MALKLERTKYYEEFLYYFDKAKRQQEACNLGDLRHADFDVGDQLMESVELYDVVERKYAGFGQILHDVFHGWTDAHPYWSQMSRGDCFTERETVAKRWTETRRHFDLEDWAYLFLVHRITGSAINYAKKPSGYNNTVLPALYEARSIDEMTALIRNFKGTKFTSRGYQFPRFPKPIEGYRIGGDYYLDVFAPQLAKEFAAWLQRGPKKTFREMGQWALNWNTDHGLGQYKFQYAAWVGDFGDFFPEFVERESPFFYGTNAVECISYLATPKVRMRKEEFLDAVMNDVYAETGSYPYNSEDIACDYIRWQENYIGIGGDYDHLDRDAVWNSSRIGDHPFGRQKPMLEMGLVDSFNNERSHPSDDKIIKRAGLTAAEYSKAVLGRL